MKKSLGKIVAIFSCLTLLTGGSACKEEERVRLSYRLNETESGYVLVDCSENAKNVVIPSEYNGLPVIGIGERAFDYCSDLAELVIPDSVKEIGAGAFLECDGLTELFISDSVERIGKDAFRYCDSLISVRLPGSLTKIDKRTFSYCGNLKEISVPTSVQRIEDYAFNGCVNLAGVIIPASVTYVGNNVFYGCQRLTIYCVAEKESEGWSSSWNSFNSPVVWGYKGE